MFIYDDSLSPIPCPQELRITKALWTALPSTCTLGVLINTLSHWIEEICINNYTPPPSLSHRTQQQGGFLPRKQQKVWKSQLKIYHNIRKGILVISTQPCPTWPQHWDIQQLHTLTDITIPPLPITNIEAPKWVAKLASLDHIAKTKTYKITTKQNTITNIEPYSICSPKSSIIRY